MESHNILKTNFETVQAENEAIVAYLRENNVCEETVEQFKKILNYIKLNTLVNAVSPFYTFKTIDVQKLRERALEKGYEVSSSPRFVGVSLKIKDLETPEDSFTAIFFRTGAINCVGLKKDTTQFIEKNTRTLVKICKQLLDLDLNADTTYTRKLSNRVYTIKIPNIEFAIEKFRHLTDRKNLKLAVDSFPGSVKSFDDEEIKKVKILIFKPGKMIITGVKSAKIKQRLGVAIKLLLADMFIEGVKANQEGLFIKIKAKDYLYNNILKE